MKFVLEFGIEPGLLNGIFELAEALSKTAEVLLMTIPASDDLHGTYIGVLDKLETDRRVLFELRQGEGIEGLSNPVAARLVLVREAFDREGVIGHDQSLVLRDSEDIGRIAEALSRGDKEAVADLRLGNMKEQDEAHN